MPPPTPSSQPLTPTKPSWLKQKERGSVLLLSCICWIALHMPRVLGRFLLYPICIYYLIFVTSNTFKGSIRYLSTLWGRRARFWHVYRHYYIFSAVIFDKVLFLSNRFQRYRMSLHGKELITDAVAKGQGCLLLGGHLGSFECMRALGTTLPGLKVRPLMYLGNSGKISNLLNGLNPELAELIINMNAPDAMLKVQEALENNEMVGILADRLPPSASNQKMVKVDFLGKKAAFPAGPFLLASVMKVPVVFFTGLYRGNLAYDVYFEPFAEELTISRESRDEDLERWISLYSQKLEHYCRIAPYNWFNFYDFWQEG